MQKKYRKCVGMMILNARNQILVGRRLDHPSGYWQMPQGGIDENENPEEAVWREMMEEIGTNNASLINSSQEWISYDIPTETLNTLPWGDKYIGQIQKWFLFRFTGIDNDINVGTENPEFSEWQWMDYDKISQNAVPFKKNVYQKIQSEFKNIINDVYQKCKIAEKEGTLKDENYVKLIYQPFDYKEVSDKIAILLTHKNINAEVKIIFQTVENLHKACPGHTGDWYFTGDYPTSGGNKVVNRSFINYIEGINKRAY